MEYKALGGGRGSGRSTREERELAEDEKLYCFCQKPYIDEGVAEEEQTGTERESMTVAFWGWLFGVISECSDL